MMTIETLAGIIILGMYPMINERIMQAMTEAMNVNRKTVHVHPCHPIVLRLRPPYSPHSVSRKYLPTGSASIFSVSGLPGK